MAWPDSLGDADTDSGPLEAIHRCPDHATVANTTATTVPTTAVDMRPGRDVEATWMAGAADLNSRRKRRDCRWLRPRRVRQACRASSQLPGRSEDS